MATVPAALRWLANKEDTLDGVHSGIAPASLGAYGYHNSRQRHMDGVTTYGRNDYSVQLPPDKRGNAKDFSAIDWSHTRSKMKLYTGRLVKAADARDPRMRYLREFFGTTNGTTVTGRSHTSPGGKWGPSTADRSHLSHIHKSFFREFANSMAAVEAVFSVESGESLSAYLIRTVGGSDMIGLKEGDKGPQVSALQVMLGHMGFYDPGKEDKNIDGDWGPNTSKAVLAMRKSQGSNASTGDEMTYYAYPQLIRAYAKWSNTGLIEDAVEAAGKALNSEIKKLQAELQILRERLEDVQVPGPGPAPEPTFPTQIRGAFVVESVQ